MGIVQRKESELKFGYYNKYLEKLESGKVYLWHDGSVNLYLGRGKENEYVFYVLGAVSLMFTEETNVVSVRHSNIQTEMINRMIIELMKRPINDDSVYWYNSKPHIIGLWGDFSSLFVDFAKMNKGYIESNKIRIGNEKDTSVNVFLSSKDLKPGTFYKSMSEEIFLYLGRDKDTNAWCFYFFDSSNGEKYQSIDDRFIKSFRDNPNEYLIGQYRAFSDSSVFSRVKTCKKLKPIHYTGNYKWLNTFHMEIQPKLKWVLNLK